MIHTFALWSPDEAREAEAALLALPEADWNSGPGTAGPQAAAVKRNRQLPGSHRLGAALAARIRRSLDQNPDFLSAALPLRVYTPLFNRCDAEHPGYGWHVDGAVRLRADGPPLRTDLSCTVMLSDPATRRGGDLVVRIGEAEHRFVLPAGHAVLYPSGHLHTVTPVTEGVRLAAFFWVQSLVADDTERTLLHTMDRQLVALRERHGESDETTALTGVYHGLLRRWSAT